jgi:hypothetical protein
MYLFILSIVSPLACSSGPESELRPTSPRLGPPGAPPPSPPPALPGRDGLEAAAHLAARLADAAHAAHPPDPRTRSEAWEAFYDPDAIHHVDIALSEEAFDALEDEGRTWAPAVVVVDGVRFPGAGVRRKGSTTWRSMYDKPSLKIKLDVFGSAPPLAGLERLTLNNMVTDPSQARENLSLRLWRALGMEASRASWAVVTVNGEAYGLYTNIEAPDAIWLRRRFLHPDGDLWEANDDADFTEDGLPWWEVVEGRGDDEALISLALGLEGEDRSLTERIGHLVDLDQFVQYWAACLVTGATDGYPFHLNDAYAYANPEVEGRLQFIPWGMDESWGDLYTPWVEGALARSCRDDEACEAALTAAVDEKLAVLEALDVAAELEAAFTTSAPYVEDDPRRPWTTAEVAAARDVLRARVLRWPETVRAAGP